MELRDYFKKYHIMKNIKRFNMETVIHPQNLCDHGYNVATIFFLICKMFAIEVSAEKLFIVMNHDFAETYTSDLNRVVKEKSPETKLAWEIIEEENLPPHLQVWTDKGIKEILGEDLFSIFQFADELDAWKYCDGEVQKGNLFLERAREKCASLLAKKAENYDLFHVVLGSIGVDL